RFIGDTSGHDAKNNTVTNCTIKGASAGATTGTIVFSTAATAPAGTGNTGNVISNNTITSSGANLPVNSIYSLGTAATPNSNTIGGIALYTSSGAATTNGILCGINVTSGNANIGTVTGNTIGATTGGGGASAASLYAACTTTGGTVVGIFATSANTVNIQNNT